MAVSVVGGNAWIAYKQTVTAGANLAGKTLITVAGAAPASAAAGVFGVIEGDVASGDYATVVVAPSIVEVIATGTVTAGSMVEGLQGTVYANISGTKTTTTSTGGYSLTTPTVSRASISMGNSPCAIVPRLRILFFPLPSRKS